MKDIPELPSNSTWFERTLYCITHKLSKKGDVMVDVPRLPDEPTYTEQALHYIACELDAKKNDMPDQLIQPQVDHSAELTKLRDQTKELEQMLAQAQKEKIHLQEQLAEAKAIPKTQVNMKVWLEQQQVVKNDLELSAFIWSNAEDSLDVQFVRFIAKAAQWDQVVKIWEILAIRCKAEQRAANDQETKILESVLAIHNLTSTRLHATLQLCDINARYDYKKMERGNQIGDSVQEVWLPGLVNAGGMAVKNVLVKTQ